MMRPQRRGNTNKEESNDWGKEELKGSFMTVKRWPVGGQRKWKGKGGIIGGERRENWRRRLDDSVRRMTIPLL